MLRVRAMSWLAAAPRRAGPLVPRGRGTHGRDPCRRRSTTSGGRTETVRGTGTACPSAGEPRRPTFSSFKVDDVIDIGEASNRRVAYELRPYLDDDELQGLLDDLARLGEFEASGLADIDEQAEAGVKPADLERRRTALLAEAEKQRAAIRDKYTASSRDRATEARSTCTDFASSSPTRRATRARRRSCVTSWNGLAWSARSTRCTAKAPSVPPTLLELFDEAGSLARSRSADQLETELRIDVAEAGGDGALAKRLRDELAAAEFEVKLKTLGLDEDREERLRELRRQSVEAVQENVTSAGIFNVRAIQSLVGGGYEQQLLDETKQVVRNTRRSQTNRE